MKRLLVLQAVVIPLSAMLIPIALALFLPNYSSISQHISETALLDHPIAAIQRLAAFATGVSLCLFAVALLLGPGKARPFTSATLLAFGASMISNGVFVMGSPLHGLYGLGFFMALVPALFVAEAAPRARWFAQLSMGGAILTMTYLWLMLSGFDPQGYRGLTQRIATVIIFGWYTLAGLELLKDMAAARDQQA